MNKQTHSEETLKRTKGIIGDEDKHKSSTENPKKELMLEYIYNMEEILNYMDKVLMSKNNKNYLELNLLVYAFINQSIRYYKKILLTKFDYDFSGIQKA